MLTFLTRRIAVSILILLVASYIVYVLTCYSGDPLLNLRQGNQRNREELMAQRSKLLNLDTPPPLRYFFWFGGLLRGVIGQLDLGKDQTGQTVTSLIAKSSGATLHLVTGALLIAVVIGITLGITTALRQYSAYDYTTTFIAFLFFSLPLFWLAVMLKQYLAIGFNDFLEDPVIPPTVIIVIALLSGVIWFGIIGGSLRRRITVFLVATIAAGAVLTFFSITKWFRNPELGPVVVIVLSLGFAALITILSAGWDNKKSRYTAVTVVGVGAVFYFLLNYPAGIRAFFTNANGVTVFAFVIVMIAAGIAIGFAYGGVDRNVSARTGAITGLVTALFILLDRFMQSWGAYATFSGGRPIATIGSANPDLNGSSFWINGADDFSHLLLPTVALVLASLAGYSRYSRASLLDVMNQDYIRTARSKGLTERTVVVRHAFRNALIPLTTIVALDFGALIGGAVITERVFGFSGMGNLFVDGVNNVDVNPVMGFFLVTGIAAVSFNIIADLIYSALDPRIRVAS